jgi:type II secretory pathway component PulF
MSSTNLKIKSFGTKPSASTRNNTQHPSFKVTQLAISYYYQPRSYLSLLRIILLSFFGFKAKLTSYARKKENKVKIKLPFLLKLKLK